MEGGDQACATERGDAEGFGVERDEEDGDEEGEGGDEAAEEEGGEAVVAEEGPGSFLSLGELGWVVM